MRAPDKPDSMILMDFPAMDAPEDHVASISTALGGDGPLPNASIWLFSCWVAVAHCKHNVAHLVA